MFFVCCFWLVVFVPFDLCQDFGTPSQTQHKFPCGWFYRTVFWPLKVTIPCAFQQKLPFERLIKLFKFMICFLENRVLLPKIWSPLSVNFILYCHMFTCFQSYLAVITAVPWAPLQLPRIRHEIFVDLAFLSYCSVESYVWFSSTCNRCHQCAPTGCLSATSSFVTYQIQKKILLT